MAVLPMAAFGVTVEPLPASDYADTEVSTNIPLAVSFDAMSRLELTLSLDASPTNGVEAAIGTDTDNDGNLSPEEADYTVGYFAQPEHADDLDHGKRGAFGQWSPIGADNSTTDLARMGRCLKPWNGGGSYSWPIPNAWRVANDACSTNVFVRTNQRFELEADGTARVSKFGWTGERGTNDTHRVYEDIGI